MALDLLAVYAVTAQIAVANTHEPGKYSLTRQIAGNGCESGPSPQYSRYSRALCNNTYKTAHAAKRHPSSCLLNLAASS